MINAAVGGSFFGLPSSTRTEVSKQFQSALVRGNVLLKAGDVDGAVDAFQQAHGIDPDDGQALTGMADAYTAKGQFEQALTAYRSLFYHAPGRRWTSSDEASPTMLMKFSLVLLKTGHEQEAVTAYNRGLRFLNYDEDKPNLEALLPAIGPSGLPYSP